MDGQREGKKEGGMEVCMPQPFHHRFHMSLRNHMMYFTLIGDKLPDWRKLATTKKLG